MNKIKISAVVPYFRGDKYLEKFLENVLEQTILNELEVVLVHNEPTHKEIELVQKFQIQHPGVINHIVIKPVEPIGTSMNRCIKNAKGEYVAIWNIDDLRTPNSFEIQKKVLDENPEVGLAYGDYIVVNTFGGRKGRLVSPPEFERKEFIKSMHCGPFPMWRKEINEKIGYFDEQLMQGADFDLMARIATTYAMKKCQGLLGYYLDVGLGLGTRQGTLQPIERTVIELRYGAYNKLDFRYYKKALKYRISEVFFDNKWFPITQFVTDYQELHNNRSNEVFLGIISWPFRIAYRKFFGGMRRLRRLLDTNLLL